MSRSRLTTVVAAAFQLRGKTYHLPPPARHHNVIWLMREEGVTEDQNEEWLQGFLLSDGSFVDRKVAAAVALEAEQTEEIKWPPDLYSEDLW